MLLDAILSMRTNQGIIYVVQDGKPQKPNEDPWTPKDAENEKERLMYQVALTGHELNSNNRCVCGPSYSPTLLPEDIRSESSSMAPLLMSVENGQPSNSHQTEGNH